MAKKSVRGKWYHRILTLSNRQEYVFRSIKRKKENRIRNQTTRELEVQEAGRGRECQHTTASEATQALSKATEEQLPSWQRAWRQTCLGKKRRGEQTSPSAGSAYGWGAKQRLLNADCISY